MHALRARVLSPVSCAGLSCALYLRARADVPRSAVLHLSWRLHLETSASSSCSAASHRPTQPAIQLGHEPAVLRVGRTHAAHACQHTVR